MQCWEKLGAPYFTEQGLEAQGSEGAVGATCAWAAEPSRSRPSSRLITELPVFLTVCTAALGALGTPQLLHVSGGQARGR